TRRAFRATTVDGLAAGVREEVGVLVDLAPDEGAEARHEVAGEPAAAHDDPESLALGLGDAMGGGERRGGDGPDPTSGAWPQAARAAVHSAQPQRSRRRR